MAAYVSAWYLIVIYKYNFEFLTHNESPAICQERCTHPMICTTPNTCECPEGYRGADCSIRFIPRTDLPVKTASCTL